MEYHFTIKGFDSGFITNFKNNIVREIRDDAMGEPRLEGMV